MIPEFSSSLPDVDPAGGRARGTVRGCAGTRRGPGTASPNVNGSSSRERTFTFRRAPARSTLSPGRRARSQSPGPVPAGSSRRAPADCGAQRDLWADSGAGRTKRGEGAAGPDAGARAGCGPPSALTARPARTQSSRGPLQEPWGPVRDCAPGPCSGACSARARVRVGRGTRPQGAGAPGLRGGDRPPTSADDPPDRTDRPPGFATGPRVTP